MLHLKQKTWLNLVFFLFSSFQITSMQDFECCIGLRKNVPSTNGYLSKTSICSSHKMHCTLERPCDANVDKMKQRVSSLPWLPSSSICNKNQKHRQKYFSMRIIILTKQYYWCCAPRPFGRGTRKINHAPLGGTYAPHTKHSYFRFNN